jgi:hypothetical protein
MIDANDLAAAFARNVMVIRMQTDGFTHADSLRQLPFRGNCLNWVLGHIVVNRDAVLEVLGAPPLLGDVGARYVRGSAPLAEEEAGSLQMDDLLGWLDRSQEQIEGVLLELDETALARPVSGGDRTRTVGQQAFFLYFHETYHVGQTELFRQLSGKEDQVI